MGISFDSRVVAPEDVMFRELDGEAVLLNLDNEAYYGLDDVGTRIWELLTSSSSIEVALHRLLQEYDVDEVKLRADLEQLVGELVANGLVRVDDAKLA